MDVILVDTVGFLGVGGGRLDGGRVGPPCDDRGPSTAKTRLEDDFMTGGGGASALHT